MFCTFETRSQPPCFAFCLNLQPADRCCSCIGEVCFPPGYVSLEILVSLAVLCLVTYVIIFSRAFLSHFSALWAPWDVPTGTMTSFLQAGCDGNGCLTSRLEPDSDYWTPRKMSEKTFFLKKEFSIFCVYACHGAVSSPSDECHCLLEVIPCSQVHWWECSLSKG